MPRTLALIKSGLGYRLARTPVAELERLRRNRRTASAIRLGEQPVQLPITGNTVDLELDIDTGTADQLALVLTDDLGYQTMVGVTPATNEVFIDRTRSGPHFHDTFPNRHVAPVDLSSRKVRLRVLVDKSIVEVLVNDGTTTLTERFFPGGKALHWSATARNGTAQILSPDVWQMADQHPRPVGAN